MKKKLYLLLAICSICLFALVACTDNQTPQESEGTTQGPTNRDNDSNGVDTPTKTDGTNGTNSTNGANETNDTNTNEETNNTKDNGLIDDIEDDIEDGVNNVSDAINDATDNN